MDDVQRKRRAWAGMVEFQRLIGRHAPAGGVFETDTSPRTSSRARLGYRPLGEVHLYEKRPA